MSTDCISVFGGLLGDMSTHTCSKPLLVVAKERKNIHPGNAELERNGVKYTKVQIYCV
jgi:hypothetical protein